jgi:hypothetical protein
MNLNEVISISVILIFAIVATHYAKPWELPSNKGEKIRRSLVIGIFTSLGACASILALGIDIKGGIDIVNFISAYANLLLCFGLPFGFPAALGYYISYRQLGWLLQQRNKIGNLKEKK